LGKGGTYGIIRSVCRSSKCTYGIDLRFHSNTLATH